MQISYHKLKRHIHENMGPSVFADSQHRWDRTAIHTVPTRPLTWRNNTRLLLYVERDNIRYTLEQNETAAFFDKAICRHFYYLQLRAVCWNHFFRQALSGHLVSVPIYSTNIFPTPTYTKWWKVLWVPSFVNNFFLLFLNQFLTVCPRLAVAVLLSKLIRWDPFWLGNCAVFLNWWKFVSVQ